MNLNINDIVSFILRYRRNSNAFKEATPNQLYDLISDAMVASTIVVDSDCLGSITGVCIAVAYSDTQCLHIVGCICITKGSMQRFASWLLRQHERDGWQLTATRRGKLIHYDTQRFLKKLIGT